MSDCAICLTNYNATNSYKTTCNHTFCFDCLILWLNSQLEINLPANCPTCRTLLDHITIKNNYTKKFPTKNANQKLSFEDLINSRGITTSSIGGHNIIMIDVIKEDNTFYDSLRKIMRHSIIKKFSPKSAVKIEKIKFDIDHNGVSYKIVFRTPKVPFVITKSIIPAKTSNPGFVIKLNEVDPRFIDGIENIESITRRIINSENPNYYYKGIIKESNSKTNRNDTIKYIKLEAINDYAGLGIYNKNMKELTTYDDISKFTSGRFVFEHDVTTLKMNKQDTEAYSKLRIIQAEIIDEKPDFKKNYAFD